MAETASPPGMAGDIPPKIVLDDTPQADKAGDTAPRILTPPTSEDMGSKHEDNSSELSDLDDEDDDDIGDVFPDHYWDGENGGKIPVFKPTMDQFRSFKKLVDKIDKYGMKSGIVKVIPPKEWIDNLPTLDEAVKTIKVKNPITQEFGGTHGMYTQANIEKQRSYNLPQWKALTLESNHQPPAKRGERRREVVAAPKPKPARPAASSPAVTPEGQKRRPGRPRKNLPKTKSEDAPVESVESDVQVPPTPTSPDRVVVREDEDEEPSAKKAKPGRPKGKPRGRQPAAKADVAKSVSSRRMNNQQEVNDIDEESFKDFDYHLEGIEEFTKERCQELEEVYWKTLNYNTPMYGADMPGSLFDERTTSWNVAQLENLLDVLGTKVPGVNTAYLYLGMWKATFAWHLEDVDLYSINYIHFGAPKQWYSISQEDARKFETAMKTLWPTDYKHCDQFLRHKTYLISPEKLKSQFNIKVNKLVHYEGEFVITYPYGYHSGFNIGYNCAESVNFATEAWLDYGRIAKKCECEADSVWVDVNEIERKLRGEPTPEYYEVTDDDSDGEDARPATPPPTKKKAASKKRKRVEPKEEAPKRKVKRVKLLLRTKTREPCVLCPNDPKFDVLLPTDTGKQAHTLCALYTPETYLVVEDGKEKVCGVLNIDKARLDLKCNYCHSKRGSCFQCASKKCTRAFHATCAAAAGVLVDEGPVPIWDEDGTEYYCEGYDFRCRFHRPRRDKKIDTNDALEETKVIRKYGRALSKGDVVQALLLSNDVFAGVVVENRPSEGCVIIDIEPEGDRIEVEYKYLLVLDPADSQRPKPSPEAKLLPEHLSNNKKVNKDNRQDGVPEIGDPFLDAASEQKWAEWNAANTAEIRNPFQRKIDLAKSEQLWHYLGKTSTEAKAQYTHDPKKPVHNTNSVFLDTVKPPVPKNVTPRHLSYAKPYTTSYSGGFSVTKPKYPANYQTGYGSSPNISRLPPQQQQQQQQQPSQFQQQGGPPRPYEYKPKAPIRPNVYAQSMPFGYGSPGYTPIASQPAASQHSSPAQGSTPQAPSHSQNANPTSSHPHQHPPTLHVRAPSAHGPNPPRASSAHGPAQSSPIGNNPHSSVPGAHSPPASTRLDNSPPYRNYYSQAEQLYSRQQSMEANYQSLASSRANHIPPTGVASVAKLTGEPAIAPPFTPPSQRQHTASLSTAEYLEHVKKYPYLKNSFLRRPQKYVSPYAAGSGFTPEWQQKINSASKPVVARPPSSSGLRVSGQQSSTPAFSPPQSQNPHESHTPVPQEVPRSRMMQYQTPQQFHQNVRQEFAQGGSPKGSQTATGGARWDFLLLQLKQNPNGHPDSGAPINGHPQSYPQSMSPTAASSIPSGNPLPLQQWESTGSTGHPVPSELARTDSRANPRPNGKSTNSAAAYSSVYGPSTPAFTQPRASYSPQDTHSPERPVYSPLSDSATPDKSTTSQPSGAMAARMPSHLPNHQGHSAGNQKNGPHSGYDSKPQNGRGDDTREHQMHFQSMVARQREAQLREQKEFENRQQMVPQPPKEQQGQSGAPTGLGIQGANDNA